MANHKVPSTNNEIEYQHTSSRLDTEWIAINALRETVGIAQKHTPTYRDTIDIATILAPDLFTTDSLLVSTNEGLLVRQFRQKANALSITRDRDITPLELINMEIDEYESLLDIPGEDTNLLRAHINKLKNARAQLTQERYTETQCILRDIYDGERDLPVTGTGKGYRDFKVNDDRGLRIRLLHPDPPEHALGADVIYETYWEKKKMVRIVVIQYKMWDGKRLYLSQSGNLPSQLNKMQKAICSRGICKPNPKSRRKDAYRLPFCTAFLRPTDRLQSINHRLYSSGYHTQICEVKRAWTKTSRGRKMLESKNIRSSSVTQNIFEELFNISMLGSGWMTYTELETLYNETSVLIRTSQIRIHAQEFGI